jgi:hypothetical protein
MHRVEDMRHLRMATREEDCRASAAEHCHLVLQLFAGHQETILRGALDRVAERADAARDDRHLVNRIGPGKRQGNQRVAHLVMRDPRAGARRAS